MGLEKSKNEQKLGFPIGPAQPTLEGQEDLQTKKREGRGAKINGNIYLVDMRKTSTAKKPAPLRAGPIGIPL